MSRSDIVVGVCLSSLNATCGTLTLAHYAGHALGLIVVHVYSAYLRSRLHAVALVNQHLCGWMHGFMVSFLCGRLDYLSAAISYEHPMAMFG